MTTNDRTMMRARELEAALAEYEKRGPDAAAEAAAIREAMRQLFELQEQTRVLVDSGGTIEAMRKLVFEGTARAAWVVREYERKHDPARYRAAH
jgi:hypothetical protein